ncbi:MAG: anthranilate synthase component I family protein [Bacteroidales bacterium]|jgi:anthranilate synthase component 1|nr:anthranilate synthase component I family protein [Bacteroidales bacterium]
MKIPVIIKKHNMLADLQTPVGIYLKVRDLFPQSALLESSDYHSSDNSFSYVGVEPVASFSVQDGVATMKYPDGNHSNEPVRQTNGLAAALNSFISSFEAEEGVEGGGFFGFTAYDTVKYFNGINIVCNNMEMQNVPDMTYILYRFVIAVNHFRNELTITEHIADHSESRISELTAIIGSRNFPCYNFQKHGEAESATSDEEFRSMVSRGVEHCKCNNVSQIVLSRRFRQPFIGDDFNVYRALRSVNPSPYLFYFDFGAFRIFGSSPETHLKIEGCTATIDPIAGTFRRTGDDERDRELARNLLNDHKENVEHQMLVDLAQADLLRNAENVEVKSFRQVQFYSHVIHMVSRVCGTIAADTNRMKVLADTFPAGTVSGAPRITAMQLINEIEKQPRGIYGGCIGNIGFNGNLNMAITIRSFVSIGNTLWFQAGAGIVAQSNPQHELEEVNNKLGALRRAIDIAGRLKN